MQSGKHIEQVILTMAGGTVEALVVTESPSGARLRERWPSIAPDPGTAVERLAVQLARRGDVDGVKPKLRVRVGRGDALDDRPELVARLLRRFASERE